MTPFISTRRTFRLALLLAFSAGCVDSTSLEKNLATAQAELARLQREQQASRLELAECREALSDKAERATALAPLPAAAAPVPEPAVPTAATTLPAPAPKVMPPPAGEEESYRAALALIQSKQPAPARAAFNDFNRRFPGSRLQPNVAFWLAEADFLEEQWQAARGGFLALVEKYPENPKSADSLYKAAQCSLKIGDKPNAIQQLNSVIRRFPTSEAAVLAKKKLAELMKKT